MFSWRMYLSVRLSSKDLLRLYLILVNVIFWVAQNKFEIQGNICGTWIVTNLNIFENIS